MLNVKNLTVRYGSLTILENISFSVEEGQWLMVVGPNGAGKSTLIHAISQGMPYTGNVELDGRNLSSLKPVERARQMGVLMQNHMVNYSFTVEEVVRLGRYAYGSGLFSGASPEDESKVEQALEQTGMQPLRKQSVLTLSGGELQRTFLAQLLAQNPKILFLDEPSNHLDLVYQKQMFGLIQEWLQVPGRAVVSVVHDLSFAKAYGTHGLLMHRGKTVAQGTVAEVIRRENLQTAYGMDVGEWMRSLLSLWQES